MEEVDDVLLDFGRLTIEEEQVEAFDDEPCLTSIRERGPCLAASFLYPVEFNVWAMKQLFQKLWQSSGEITILEPMPNRFIVIFPTVEAMEKVLAGGPWLFDENILLLRRWEPSARVDNLAFEELDVWLQVRNLPWFLLNETDLRKAIRGMGEVIKTDSRILSSRDGDYMRARVRIRVSEPLRRGGYITVFEEKIWLDYRYERLPKVCGWCGVIAHDGSSCAKRPVGSPTEIKEGYGDWLLFRPPPKKRKNIFGGNAGTAQYPRGSPRQADGRRYEDEHWDLSGAETDDNLDGGVGDQAGTGEVRSPVNGSDIAPSLAMATENEAASHSRRFSKEEKGKTVAMGTVTGGINTKRKASDISPNAKDKQRENSRQIQRGSAAIRGRTAGGVGNLRSVSGPKLGRTPTVARAAPSTPTSRPTKEVTTVTKPKVKSVKGVVTNSKDGSTGLGVKNLNSGMIGLGVKILNSGVVLNAMEVDKELNDKSGSDMPLEGDTTVMAEAALQSSQAP